MQYKTNNMSVKVCKTLPKGWEVDNYAMTQPVGTVWINNGKSLFTKGKDGKPQRRQALLIQNEELMITRIAEKRRYKQPDSFILDKKTEARVRAEMNRQTRAQRAWEAERAKRTQKVAERLAKKPTAKRTPAKKSAKK